MQSCKCKTKLYDLKYTRVDLVVMYPISGTKREVVVLLSHNLLPDSQHLSAHIGHHHPTLTNTASCCTV
jgi:hypothetical protein